MRVSNARPPRCANSRGRDQPAEGADVTKPICAHPDCGEVATRRGYCKPHHRRLIESGELPRLPRIPESERFWAKVQVTGFCWLWTGSKTNGYGRFCAGDKSTRHWIAAHRYAYEDLVGLIPSALQLDHLCRIPACVNPDHLEPVTAQTNNRRSYSPSGKRHRQSACKRGHEFTPANTIITARGSRLCRKCSQLASKAQAAKRRELRQPRPPRQECSNGHPLIGDNVTMYDGVMGCRQCKRDRDRIATAARRARAKAAT